MHELPIYLVDAFASESFFGNPAAVVMVDEFPQDEQCLNIAQELNQSETAFLKQQSNSEFDIRWFTPLYEVGLCGHASLAAAHIIFEQGDAELSQLKFNSRSGELLIKRVADGYQLDFPVQPIEERLDIADFSSLDLPISEAARAVDVCILELDSENAVRDYQPDFASLKQLGYRGIIITAPAEKPYDIVSRYFVPESPVPEDPVTGSAHCKLIDYWSAKLGKHELLAYQASKRGGELKLMCQNGRVLITGKAVTVLTGVISL